MGPVSRFPRFSTVFDEFCPVFDGLFREQSCLVLDQGTALEWTLHGRLSEAIRICWTEEKICFRNDLDQFSFGNNSKIYDKLS